MADSSIAIKFEINGVQTAVQGFRDLSNAAKTFEERIKSNLNGFNNWNSSSTTTEQHTENLRNKIDILNKMIEVNAAKIKEAAGSSDSLNGAQLRLYTSNEKLNASLQAAQTELNAIQTGLTGYNQQTAESEARTRTLDATLNLYSVALQRNKYDIEALNASKQTLITRLHEEEATVKSTEAALKAAEQVYAGNEVEIEKYRTAHVNAQAAVEKTKIEIEELNNQIRNLDFAKASEGFQQLANFAQAAGRAFQGLSTAAATILATSVEASISYESAFAGVKKTTDDLEVAVLALSGELQANGDAWDYNAVKAAASTETVKNAINTGYAQIKEDLLALGTVTASTSEEIMNVAEYAGQLGIPAEQIAAFTKVAIEMGDSTMLSADEAAMAMARLANVLMEDGLTAEQTSHWYEQLGSVIVELGNNAAATEPEITNVLTRIAAVGKQSNFTTAELAAMATAVVSVGVKYESGGTAIMNTMSGIEKAVGKGGDAVKKFADVAGMSAQEFTIAWKTEPMTAMEAFLKGLQNMGSGVIKTSAEIDEAVKASANGVTEELEEIAKVAGMTAEEFAQAWSEDKAAALEKYQDGLEGVNLESEAAVTILSELGINSKRQVQTILSLAASEQDLERYIKLANNEWERSVALETEANKRYATLQSALTELGNAWRNVASILGDAVAPVIKAVAKLLTDLALILIDAPKPLVALTAGFLGLVAAIAPVMNSIGMFAANMGMLAMVAKDTNNAFAPLAQIMIAPFKKLGVAVAESSAKVSAETAGMSAAASKLGTKFASLSATSVLKFTAIGAAIAAVSVLIYKLITDTDGTIEAFKNLGNKIEEIFSKVVDTITNIVTTIVEKLPEIISKVAEAIPEIIQNIADNLPTMFQNLLDGIGNMADAIVQHLPEIVSSALDAITGVIEAGTNAITQFADQLPSVIDNFMIPFIENLASSIEQIIETITAMLPQIAESAVEIVTNIAESITTNLPKLVESGVKIVTSIIEGITQNLGKIIEAGLALIAALIQAIIEALPTLIEAAIQIVTTLVTCIVENLPLLIEAGVQIITTLIASIVEYLPQLLELGVQLIGQLVTAIIQNLPKLVEAGVQIIATLAQAILTNIPTIIQAAIDIGTTLVTTLAETIGSLIETVITAAATLAQGVVDKIKELWADATSWATEMVTKLITGIGNMIESIVQKAHELANNVKEKIKSLWADATSWAVEMVTKLVQGIAQKISEIVQKAYDLANQTKQKIKDTWADAFNIGANLIQGIINGVQSLASSLISLAQSIASQVKATLESALEIGSPSRWGKRVGAFLFEGIEIGFEDEANSSYSSMYNATRNALRAIDDASARELSKAIDNTRQINATAHNQINTFIDYDRLAEIIGERGIYLNDRLVGRELRNMGVQIV